jgi:hypothetical protein
LVTSPMRIAFTLALMRTGLPSMTARTSCRLGLKVRLVMLVV